mgnify:FL=1
MDGTLIVRATREQEQGHVPCHILAVHALRVAEETGKRWIRVVRRGHDCQLGVPELRQHVDTNWMSVPRCLVMGQRAHRWAGNTMETRRPNWPGLVLAGS